MSLLTVREIQNRLRVSRACVYALIESGRLPAIRIGVGRGTIRVDEADLDAFVTARRGDSIRPGRLPGTATEFVQLDADRLRRAWHGSE
jgi:excisionase family DNA binding protein